MSIARIIVGSSNVRRFYTPGKFSEYDPYKIEFCTVKRMFEVTMEALPSNAFVIISAIENFIEKEVGQEKEEAANFKILEEVVGRFIGTIVESAKKNLTSRFAVAYPLLRPGSKWMTANEDRIRQEFERAYNGQSCGNISKIDCVTRGSQIFIPDGVHLTEKAGNMFVGNLLGMAEDCFAAEVINIDTEKADTDIVDKIAAIASGSKDGVAVAEMKRTATEMREWRDRLERNLDNKFKNDNLVFARLREEIDSEINRKKEDRTLILNYVDSNLIPAAGKEKNDFLKKCGLEFCKKLDEGFNGEVLFASANGRPDKGKLMLEFRLDSVEKARDIRKQFAVKRIAKTLPEGFENLQVMSVVTQGTRVRTEIMRAIGRKIETNTQVGYDPTYLPRPILHIKAKDNSEAPGGSRRHIRSLTFADAVSQYGNRLEFSDLGHAYEKAAHNFEGQMRQNFVVLRDKDELHSRGWGARGRGSGTPRGSGGPRGGMRGTKRHHGEEEDFSGKHAKR
jgi:hypothetical protein